MRLLVVLCARNLMRHRGRSLVVGIILFLGAVVMTVGNGVLSGMERGLRENIREGFLGDVVVASSSQISDNVLMGVMGKGIARLDRYPEIRDLLHRDSSVQAFTPVGKNVAMVLNEDDGYPSFAYLLGVDWNSYRKVFPNRLVALEGAREPTGDSWVLLPTAARDMAFEQMGEWFVPKPGAVVDSTLSDGAKERRSSLRVRDEMVLMGYSEENATSDVRLPIQGVVRYRALNKIWGWFALVDIESYRRSQGYLAAAEQVVLDSGRAALMGMEAEGLDDLFGGSETPDITPRAPLETPVATAPAEPDAAAWNLVLVRLRPGEDPDRGAARIDAALKAAALPARAIVWNKAAGPIGGMAVLIKGALFVFVALLFVVAAIIVMNTLSMAAMERSTEIGMMRAIGASKNFIRAQFAGETAILAAVFGGSGILVGALVVVILRALQFTTDNDFLQMAYGGEAFRPVLGALDWGLAVLQLVGTSVTALVYPMGQAARITPLEAIQRD
jgi:putative ABC transport system permease protein